MYILTKKVHDICVFSCQSREGRPDLEMLNALQIFRDGKMEVPQINANFVESRETINHGEKTILHIYELIIPLSDEH